MTCGAVESSQACTLIVCEPGEMVKEGESETELAL